MVMTDPARSDQSFHRRRGRAWRTWSRRLILLALFGTLIGCASVRPAPDAEWLTTGPGWKVRDLEESESATWVAFDRAAPGTNVKEIRVVGLVDSDPETTMRALRHRLLAEEYLPDGFELTVLEESQDEVLTYGLAQMPWPIRDREVTERMQFSHDPETGVFRVDVHSVDSGERVQPGVVRVELVRSVFLVEPEGRGSVLTASSVHDLGGAFPNSATYAPIRKGMVDMLFDVRSLSTSLDHTLTMRQAR